MNGWAVRTARIHLVHGRVKYLEISPISLNFAPGNQQKHAL